MVSIGSRRGEAGARSLPLMIVAFLVVGLFLVWLSMKATPVEVEVLEDDPMEQELFATVVATDVFGADPLAQADMLIQLHGLPVQSLVGSEAFFAGVTNQTGPYLVKMLPEVVANGVVVESGATVSVTGRVYAMSDSVADAWVASGGIGEGDRILAVFAESFFEVERVTVTAQPRPEDD